MEASKTVPIPENVDVTVEGKLVTVTGDKGKLTRDFSHTPLSIKREGDAIEVYVHLPRKKENALVGTIASHIQNMITGVKTGFTYKMKIVFSHFPITVKVEGKKVLIENFTGERSARKAKIMGDVQVESKGEDVIIKGINLEDVSQTAANIQLATKIKKKDPRIFLDGLYVYEKLEGMMEQ